MKVAQENGFALSHKRDRLLHSLHNRAQLSRLAALALVGLSPVRAAETLALWTFESSLPTTSGPHIAEEGSGSASAFHADTSTSYTHPIGNGSASSFNSNRWAIGDYYEFRLSTSGYQELLVSWDQIRSSTGPALFDFAYSTNGTDFSVAVDDYVVSSNAFSSTTTRTEFTRSVELWRIAELNNAAQVWFRLIGASAPGGTTGTSRVDNFKVTGELFVPAVLPLYWSPTGAESTGTWDYESPNWSATPSAGGPQTGYDSVYAAVIGWPGLGTDSKTLRITASGVASAGLHFESSGYLVNGGALTLEGAAPAIHVSHEGDSATIEARVLGNSGLVKTGEGTLILSGQNDFSGTVTVTAGTLAIAGDAALGASANNVFLKGGTLNATSTVDLASRDLSGKGTLLVEEGAHLSTTGHVDFENLTIAGGEVEFLGAVARTASLTLGDATTLRTAAGLQLGNGGITLQQGSGTARIEGGLDLAGATRTVTVANGSSEVDLAISGALQSSSGSGKYKLHKLGEGTLELEADFVGTAGLRIGTAGSLGSAISGGRVLVQSAAALGGNTLELNYGLLEIAFADGRPAPNLTGDSLVLLDVSLGGVEGGGGVVISGGDVEFFGGLRLFKPAGATVSHTLEIRNHTILAGGLQYTSDPATGTFAGLRLLGNGTFSLRNPFNDFSDPLVVDGPTLEVDGLLAAPQVKVLRGSVTGNTIPGTAGLFGDVTIGDALPGPATISPGSSEATRAQSGISGASFGVLLMKSLTLLSDATVRLELNSASGELDQISLTEGPLILDAGSRLELYDSGNAVLAQGLELTIIALPFDLSVEGAFSQQVFVAGKNIYEIFYNGGDGNDVALRVIPEPATAFLLVASAIHLALGRMPCRPRSSKGSAGGLHGNI